ncbi:MAG: hypothetical protein LBS92_06795, partial [Candidatus Methanoplasma sp.]|nr:hypothetical protein [Candidatus Methanoplasma sp.]
EIYAASATGTYVSGLSGPVTIHVPATQHVALLGTADGGFYFEKWQKGGIDYSTTATIYLDSTGVGSYEASFMTAMPPATTYTVSASADSGATITPSGSTSVSAGGSVTFSFSAKAGHAIADVVVDGASVPSAVSAGAYTFSGVGSNHTISVTSKPFTPAPVDGDGSGDGKDGNDGSGGSGDGNGGISSAAFAVAALLAIAAAGSAVFWFAFGPGRSFEVVKVTSSVPIVGRDKARYKKAYRFYVEGDADAGVRYRIGEDGAWKAPARADGGYEIPKGDVTATVTIEAE